ncbi:hypothetical protein Aperf_G00000113957 [Anoplocephala perfoliata]
MDDELDGVFSAEIDEEYEKSRPEEVGGVSQNHETYFENDIKPEDDGGKENCCIRFLKVALMPTIYLQTYFFTDIVQQFTSPLDSSSDEAFSTISDRSDMWKYVQNGFLTALYSGNGDNRLVGRPRIRQLRVRNVDCLVPSSVPEYLQTCFPNFSSDVENQDPITPAANVTIALSKDAWRWRSSTESGNGGVSGTMASYTGSGYYLDLDLTRQVTSQMLTELFTGEWTAESTRALIIDFTLYNANLNFFCIGQILFETPYTGGVIASADLRTLHLISQNSPTDYVVFIFEIISLFFVAYYIFREVRSICKMGLSYFRHFWHLVDFFVISVGIICVGLNLYNRIRVMRLLNGGVVPDGIYPDFNHIAYTSLLYNRLLALLVFFSLIQIFKFFSFSETLGQLTATMNYALYDMVGFTVMFAIVFSAFAQAGTIMFSSTSSEFKSFDMTALALYRIILGDFDMDAIKAAHLILGPIFFIIYIFFVFFVLLNMFLAIIGEAYAKVKEDMAKRKNDFKFIGYIKYNTKEFFAKFGKKRRMPLGKVLESAGVGDQMELTFANWRRAMKAAGYSEMEAVFLFQKYDKDADNMLDMVERRKMREDLKLGTAFQPPDSEDEDDKATNSEKSKLESNKDVFAEREDCEELVERIVDVEESVNTVVKQICSLLGHMERAERARRENEHALIDGIF